MKRQSIDFPGIVIGIVIGLIFGFLINSRLREPILAPTISETDSNSLVIIQLYKSDSPEAISVFCETMTLKEIKTVWVQDGDQYFVYYAIAKEEEDLASFKAVLEQKQVSYVVKHQSLYNYPNNVIGEDSYEFWKQGVYNFLMALDNKTFTVDQDYLSHPYHSEFHKNILYLNAIQNNLSPEAKNTLLLETYKLIVQELS